VFGVANKRSIAWAIAQAWHREGAKLAFTYQGERLKDNVEELAGTFGADTLILPCDVTSDEQVRNVFGTVKESFGRLDLLLHSVAFAPREALEGDFLNTSREAFRVAHDVSAYSLIGLAREAAPLMDQGGSIVAMSYYGAEKVIPHYNVMGVAKASLEASTRYLAYSLGKSQETIQQLAARGLRLVTHESIHAISALYTSLGVPIDARCWDGAFRDGEVGLFPPFHKHRPYVTEPIATAVLTGWALEPWGARRSGADVAFPVSDHADYPSLVEFAKATGAREVITLFGFAEELALGLRKEGLFARAVSEKMQLDLFGAAVTPVRKAARIR
jgi:enoyl-[acyl-carrier protein] reductase I